MNKASFYLLTFEAPHPKEAVGVAALAVEQAI